MLRRQTCRGLLSVARGVRASNICATGLLTRRNRIERLSIHKGLCTSANAELRHPQLRPLYTELAGGAEEISRARLMEAVRQALPQSAISDDEFERLFTMGDIDSSGSIDFARFVSLFDGLEDDNVRRPVSTRRPIDHAPPCLVS